MSLITHPHPKRTDLAPALILDGVGKRFGDLRAVSDLTVEVNHGEIVSFVGPSGCGKTTTLRMVAGLEQADTGRIFIGGADRTNTPPERRGVGMVFQDYALFPHLTVAENVSFGLRGGRADRQARVDEMLHMVGLSSMAGRYPSSLSGGQQQRVALARALAPGPEILLLDEPLSNLDPQLRREIRHEVTEILRASGAAVLWVTHDHDEGLIIADRVVVMDAGRARQIGTPAEVWRNPADEWVASFIGHGDLIDGVVSNGTLTTALGDLEASWLPEGAPAKVLVKPQNVMISDRGPVGTVVRRHFSGDDNIYCVKLDDGPLLHTRQPSGTEIARGTRVRLQLAETELPIFH